LYYEAGISTCIQKSFKDDILGSVAKESYAGIGIWTVDKKAAMEEYIQYGVTCIMTNYVQDAVDVIGRDNLSKPGFALLPVSRDLPFTY
jgi:hypothetical protein